MNRRSRAIFLPLGAFRHQLSPLTTLIPARANDASISVIGSSSVISPASTIGSKSYATLAARAEASARRRPQPVVKALWQL